MRRKTVLIVEDDPDEARGMRAALAADGHEVHVAQDAEAALRSFQELSPDLVLMDLDLPETSGLELVGRMRALPSGRDAAILAVTALTRDYLVSTTMLLGFDAYFSKPLNDHAIRAIRFMLSDVPEQPT
jgi:two-component system OmpR family response regulator